MSDIRLTPAQHEAVHARGSSLIVSAAAGSGKTRVLVERLMAYISDPDDPRDIDSFLIITYTRAAAAELRSRILREITSLCAKCPDDLRLRRQAALCHRAQIGTIHSFCSGVLRENCHLLGLAPDFKVADEDRVQVIKQNSLDRVLERRYDNMGADPGFQSLVDTVGAGRDDARLASVVLDLHMKMQSHAYPADWANGQTETMRDAGEPGWAADLMARFSDNVRYWSRATDALVRELCADEESNEKIIKAYGASLTETAGALSHLQSVAGDGWDSVRKALPVPFPRLGSLRNPPDPDLAERVKLRRDACKKAMASLNELFSCSWAEHMEDMEKTRPAMEALLRLTLDFDAAFAAEKRRAGLVDYSDLEHLAAQLLADRQTGLPTDTARELSRRYTEIMVDEYQDVNAVQDLIFFSVSREGKNLFMVGDVKQSVYRFRLADPGIFLDKYHRYSQDDTDNGSGGRRVLLQENFRSRRPVLDAANHIFSNIMSTGLGELDYDDDARLKYGADYPPQEEGPIELSVLTIPPALPDGDSPDKTALEAKYVAEQIRRLVDSGDVVTENGRFRPARYDDIVILLRSPGTAGRTYSSALEAEGVPVVSGQGSDFFTSLEISVMISLLAVIDNPHQDVPLISVLRSPIFGFSADDLVAVRSAGRSDDFFTALRASAGTMEKSRAFLDFLDELRSLAEELPTDELIWRIYSATDLPALCEVMPGGEARRENLMLLHSFACDFEASGYRGLFRFVAYLRRMTERGEDIRVPAASSGNAVRIMSIHKSKGLEFPIVFLADTGRRFNKLDIMQPVLIHPQLGLGPKLSDTDRGLEYPTLARRAIADRILRETLSEEMRVLYVAMTRARERLFISCALRDPEKTIQKLSAGLDSPIAPEELISASSCSHWLIAAALLDDGGLLRLTVESPVDGAQERGDIQAPPERADAETADDIAPASDELRRRLDYVYPRAAAAALPSKITVTELKGLERDASLHEEAGQLDSPEFSPEFRRPDFEAKKRLTGAQAGSATHLFLQHVDFALAGSPEELRAQADAMCESGLLTPEQAQAVDTNRVFAFLSSDLGGRIRSADRLLREFRFSLLTPADSIYPGAAEDSILLQGVVDCCIEERGELTIIDYKTDYVNHDAVQERAEHYRNQVLAYAAAMTRITEKPVRQAVLYFLRPGEAVEFDL